MNRLPQANRRTHRLIDKQRYRPGVLAWGPGTPRGRKCVSGATTEWSGWTGFTNIFFCIKQNTTTFIFALNILTDKLSFQSSNRSTVVMYVIQYVIQRTQTGLHL